MSEPDASPPVLVDHRDKSQFDVFLTKIWQLPNPEVALAEPKRLPNEPWARLVKSMVSTSTSSVLSPEERDQFELKLMPLAIQALDDFLPGIAKVVAHDALSLASVARAYSLWAKFSETDRTEVDVALPQRLTELLRQERLSQPREFVSFPVSKSKSRPKASVIPKVATEKGANPEHEDFEALIQQLSAEDLDDELGENDDGDVKGRQLAPEGQQMLKVSKSQLDEMISKAMALAKEPSATTLLKSAPKYGTVSTQNPLVVSRALGSQDVRRTQTPAQVNNELARSTQSAPTRIFHNLPIDELSAELDEADLLTCENWVSRPYQDIVAQLSKYFTTFPTTQPRKIKDPKDKEQKLSDNKNLQTPNSHFSIQKELKDYVKKSLPVLVARVFRTFRQGQDPRMANLIASDAFFNEYLYALRDADTALQELVRKRTVMQCGSAKAEAIDHRLRTYKLTAPQWLKCRDALLSGFRGGMPSDATASPLDGVIDC